MRFHDSMHARDADVSLAPGLEQAVRQLDCLLRIDALIPTPSTFANAGGAPLVGNKFERIGQSPRSLQFLLNPRIGDLEALAQ